MKLIYALKCDMFRANVVQWLFEVMHLQAVAITSSELDENIVESKQMVQHLKKPIIIKFKYWMFTKK